MYQLLIPSTLPTFYTPLLGVLQENGFLHLPCSHQPAPGRNAPYWAPAPVVAPCQIPRKVVQPLHPPTVEGYVWGMGGAALK